jgi:chorismate synthase
MRILPSSLLLAILFAYPAMAQAVYGNVYGTTTDQSGALIAGARITILDVAKGTVVQTASNASGNYTVTQCSSRC